MQASCYFILEKGEVEIIIDSKLIRTLKSGDAFGEMALLYNAPRSASIKSKSRKKDLKIIIEISCADFGVQKDKHLKNAQKI